jgi:hypothetical protein
MAIDLDSDMGFSIDTPTSACRLTSSLDHLLAASFLPPYPPTYSWTRDTKSRIQQRYAQQRCQGEGNKDSGAEPLCAKRNRNRVSGMARDGEGW